MYILACSITSIESKLVFDLPLNLKMGSNGLLGSLTYVYITQTDDQSKFLSCDVTFGQIRRSDQSKTVEWYNCPAGCTTLNQFEVIGKENGFYSIHSSICRSAIHKGIISGSFCLVLFCTNRVKKSWLKTVELQFLRHKNHLNIGYEVKNGPENGSKILNPGK